MINRRLNLRMLAVFSGIVWLVFACQAPLSIKTPETTPSQTHSQVDGSANLQIPIGCPSSFSIASTLTSDTSGDNQSAVNCFAWQSFIALNWSADPNNNGQPDPSSLPNAFGQPGDTFPTVWETYKAAQDVFLPGAKPPDSWNAPGTIPPACAAEIASAGLQQHQSIFYMTSKSSADEVVQDSVEAGTHQILVDQTGRLIRFEKRINQVEFNYIFNTGLYDANQQATTAINTGIVLPQGSIEVKAAWRILDNEPDEIKTRYKQTIGFLYDAPTNTCNGPVTMGLIALHIIRKTGSMRSIMWSTFEQIDNVPGSTAHPTEVPYTLYNPGCIAPAPCSPNATPQPTPAPPAQPTYEPVQVQRTPIPGDVQGLNGAVQTWIMQANPTSVWQYYQLVNVFWPQNGGSDPNRSAKIPVPIAQAGFTSSGSQDVSNVALETYVQNTNCTDCHVSAAIAASSVAGCSPSLASDFSFVFDDASTTDNWRAGNCPTPMPTSTP